VSVVSEDALVILVARFPQSSRNSSTVACVSSPTGNSSIRCPPH
jgi:hypothetical protein